MSLLFLLNTNVGVVTIFLANWLVNKDYHGFQLVGWNYCCDLNGAKWPWIMLFMHENKLEVEKDFQGMKILIVWNFSYKGETIMIIDFESQNKVIWSRFLHESCISMFYLSI